MVGILHGSQELVASLGVTNVDHPLQVTDSTLFQLGSTTKTYTASALMRKVEQGVLDLEAPLQSYLPELELAKAEWARQVTPRHLLTHTGSWDGDYFIAHPVGGRGGDALASVVEALPRIPLLTPPGTVFHYNLAGFSVAGRLLEVLTGQRFEASIRELLFRPLELTSSFFLPEQVITRRFAVGHMHTGRGELQVARNWAVPRCMWPTGGIVSDVHDQLRWARFHLGDGKAGGGERLLDRQTLARMQSPQVEVGDWPEAVGLSWMIGSLGDATAVVHGGGTSGQCSLLAMIPEQRFALVVLANADSGGFLVDAVSAWVHDRVLGLARPRPEPVELPPATLQEYVGSYERALATLTVKRGRTGLELDVATSDPRKAQAQAQRPGSVPVGFSARDRVVVLAGLEEGYVGTFLRDGDGAIEWLRWGGRLHRRAA